MAARLHEWPAVVVPDWFVVRGANAGAVLDALREHGFTGLRYADLFGLTPPAELVSKLGEA
jgi:hypothetical protein